MKDRLAFPSPKKVTAVSRTLRLPRPLCFLRSLLFKSPVRLCFLTLLCSPAVNCDAPNPPATQKFCCPAGQSPALLLLSAPLRPVPSFLHMATKPTPVSAPLTFDLPLELLTKIGTLQKKSGLGSTSEVVRQALREFDFGSYQSAEPERRQISVRLPPEVRRFLLKTAKKKKVSLGELLRAAIEALSAGRRKG